MKDAYAGWDITPADIYDSDLTTCWGCEETVWWHETSKGDDGQQRCADCHDCHVDELKKEGVIL